MTKEEMSVCKYGALSCGTHYDCGGCLREKREKTWRSMTPAERRYDVMVDPLGQHTSGITAPGGDRFMYEDQEPQGCSCHLSAPCGYCTSQGAEDEA